MWKRFPFRSFKFALISTAVTEKSWPEGFCEFSLLRHFRFVAKALVRIPGGETFRNCREIKKKWPFFFANIFCLGHKLSFFEMLFWGVEYPFKVWVLKISTTLYKFLLLYQSYKGNIWWGLKSRTSDPITDPLSGWAISPTPAVGGRWMEMSILTKRLSETGREREALIWSDSFKLFKKLYVL